MKSSILPSPLCLWLDRLACRWVIRIGSQRAIRNPNVWYHDGDHAVRIRMRSMPGCHDVRCDPLQHMMRLIGPMHPGPPARHSSSPRRPTADVRPKSIAARSSTRCAPTIAPGANGACFRTMFRQCVSFAPLSTHGIVMEPSSKSLLNNRPDKRDVPSFRSDGWWNARLRGRDAIGWRARNTTATQNQAKPLFILVLLQCS